MTTFTQAEIDEIIHAAFDFFFEVSHGMQLPKARLTRATSRCPWLGLGEMSTVSDMEILDILKRLDAAEVENEDTVDKWARELAVAVYDKALGKPVSEFQCHRQRLLLKQPALIPFIKAMAQYENWDFTAKILTNEKSICIPPIQSKNNLTPIAIPKSNPPTASSTSEPGQPDALPPFQHPQVNSAIIQQLGQWLNNAGNVSSWRGYTSVLGVRILAGMDQNSRDYILSDGVVPGFAYQRYIFEAHERKACKAAAAVRKSTAEAEAARKAKEKIAVLEATIKAAPKP